MNKICHIYNRGVEKREIFLNDRDRLRFIYSLALFNNNESTPNNGYFFDTKSLTESIEVRLRYAGKKLVKILAFTLMPNHFHLMVEETLENGITEFMRKLGTGYTNYFNKKYERVGPLFQGKFKSILLTEERHFMYLPYYIHLNPLDILESGWKDKGIKDFEKAINFLATYRWSSHADYLGKRNFQYLLDTKLLNEVFETPERYRHGIIEWLKEKNHSEVDEITLE